MDNEKVSANIRLILDSISDGVYVTTEDREIIYWSAGAERLTGYSAEEVVGMHCYDNILVHTDANGRQLCYGQCPLARAIETGAADGAAEVFLQTKDGRRLPVYVKMNVYLEDGQKRGVEVFGTLEAVAGREIAEQVQELSRSSITDPLTGLFNRRYFDAYLDQQFELYKRLDRTYGVLFLDIDRFKNVNDRLGHLVGDATLKFIADIISKGSRKMDVAARYGGDEFALICAVANLDQLEIAGRRLVSMVQTSHFMAAERAGMKLTVSAGGALVEPRDATVHDVLARADEAMYRVKRSGRDGLYIAEAA
jgi:diguanylate cyclase (GGDEF)-like protein/PAS domain S-box-containing protein